MHYLKCNNCGHFNPVNTEYLVFCASCGKRLDNNYTEWKSRNSDKTLEDYKQLVCISDDEMQKMAEEKPKKKNLKYWIFYSIGFALLFSIGTVGGKYLGDTIGKFFSKTTHITDQQWTQENYNGMELKTPFLLTKMDQTLPDNIKEFIEKMDTYGYTSSDFNINVTVGQYNSKAPNLSLQGAANGAINGFKSKSGVTDFQYTEESLIKNEVPGFIQHGKFKLQGIDAEIVNVVFLRGQNMWQVTIMYQAKNTEGPAAAQKMVDSIVIAK